MERRGGAHQERNMRSASVFYRALRKNQQQKEGLSVLFLDLYLEDFNLLKNKSTLYQV